VASVGTLAWAERSGGVLRSGGRLRLVVGGVVGLIESGWGKAAGLGLAELDLVRTLEAPQSTVARAANELCAKVSPPSLYNHCLRTYAWAVLLAARDGAPVDREALYVASVLHDLGLCEAYRTPDGGCFAVHGGREASGFLRRLGWPEARALVVAEAISLHLNTYVGSGFGAEAELLHQGAALDVIGLRFKRVPRAARERVVAAHPRLDMKRELAELMREQAHRSPQSRAAFLCGLGFVDRINAAPFAS
jgi:hypothetical protein